jgi:CelD/BcsL family acetyltransferase involved in cellulose biosynthesis
MPDAVPEPAATNDGTDAAMTVSTDTRARCAVLESAAALHDLHDELAELADRPGATSSIVQHPDWLQFELESRGDAAAPYVVVARNPDGRIVGYAPFLAVRQSARIALGGRHVTLYRGRILRLLGSCVVALPHERAQAQDMIAEALARDRAVKVILIQETVLPNPLAHALSRARRGFASVPSNLLDQVNWSIAPQPSLAVYLENLGSRRKKLGYALRNVYKKLGKEAQLRIFEAPEQVDDYCRLMNQLYAKSWHATKQGIDWELPARRALFTTLARQQRLVGHMLMRGPQPVAYVHGYRLGGRYLFDSTGYDEEFAALGVGSALIFGAIQDLIERHPADTIDFGYGDNQYKRVLATDQAPCGSLYLVRGTIVRVRFSLIAPLRMLYRWLHRARGRIRSARRPRSESAALSS